MNYGTLLRNLNTKKVIKSAKILKTKLLMEIITPCNQDAIDINKYNKSSLRCVLNKHEV